jgi:hypothetical protein
MEEKGSNMQEQGSSMKEKGQQFFEAMPATMNQMGQQVSDKLSDKSFLRRTLPWLLIPAAILLGKAVMGSQRSGGNSDSGSDQGPQNNQ